MWWYSETSFLPKYCISSKGVSTKETRIYSEYMFTGGNAANKRIKMFSSWPAQKSCYPLFIVAWKTSAALCVGQHALLFTLPACRSLNATSLFFFAAHAGAQHFQGSIFPHTLEVRSLLFPVDRNKAFPRISWQHKHFHPPHQGCSIENLESLSGVYGRMTLRIISLRFLAPLSRWGRTAHNNPTRVYTKRSSFCVLLGQYKWNGKIGCSSAKFQNRVAVSRSGLGKQVYNFTH